MSQGIAYGELNYWNERYTGDSIQASGAFEWYQRFDDFKELFNEHLGTTGTILHVGCGNSLVGVDAAVANVAQRHVNVDFSPVVIATMTERTAAHAARDRVEFRVEDVTCLSFGDDTFDGAFDKGTIDAICCGADSFNKVEQAVREIHRVLRKGAKFVMISYGDPTARQWHLEKLPWAKVHCLVVSKPRDPDDATPAEDQITHYMYVCEKAK